MRQILRASRTRAGRALTAVRGGAARILFGARKESTTGSNMRRATARIALILALLFLLDLFLSQGGVTALSPGTVGAVVLVAGSVYFIVQVSVALLFLLSRDYPPDPFRLIFDLLISALTNIVAFAEAYRFLGIVDGTQAAAARIAQDDGLSALYFSMVTFSTLGYGDFRPDEATRLLAALQAILGNLHLGFLTAALFYSIEHRPGDFRRRPLKLEDDRKQRDGDDG